MSDLLQGKLDDQEIRLKVSEYKFTSGFKPTKHLIDSIIEKFWFHDLYNSFISDEVYLKFLLEYLDKEKPNTFNRYHFYLSLFDRILAGKKDRTVLQQIALDFEKRQSDAIAPIDYQKLLKRLGVSTDKFDITWMKKNQLGKIEDREEQKLFVWKHHTLTEFLVAEYLLQQKGSLGEFQRLVILEQDGVTAFRPSWSGVLRFLLESLKGNRIHKWFIQFLEENKDNVDDNISELLTFVDVNPPRELRSRIFNLIYNSYFDRLVWLPVWTRSQFYKFIESISYARLKKDIRKWPDQTETFVKRGNVVAIIDSLLEYKSQFFTKKDKLFWEKKLIGFVNNPEDSGNGVLQRHSLSALAQLKKPSIISLVDKVADSEDTLLRDAFIQFCIDTDPNSKDSIANFINGIKKGSDIYARYGLYKATKQDSIKYLLKKIAGDDEFWKSFLKHQSIFDKEDGDLQLIKNIKKILDEEMINLLKRIIFRIFEIEGIYREEKSNFIKQIVLLINSKDNKFVFEILDKIHNKEDDTKSLHSFFDYEEILAILLTVNNVDTYFKKIKDLSSKIQERADSIVYVANRINGSVGRAVYEKAVKLKKVKPINEQVANLYWEKQQTERKQGTIKDFQKLLEPSPGKYSPNIFGYYLNKQKELDEYFKTKNGAKAKKKLVGLAIDEGIAKINPQEFKVSIPDKDVRQFTWSAVASYYGKVLSVVKNFNPGEIKKHRQQIIDFIPFAYSNDMSLIMDLIEKIDDKELKFVNKIMSDEKDDRRYLIPGTYIYLVGHYAKKECKLPSVKSILISFVGDRYIPEYEQSAAIEALPFFIEKSDKDIKAFLKHVFDGGETNGQKTELAEVANSVLIKVYKDEDAINWRFEKIKTPLKFDRRRLEGIEHSVGPEEREIDSFSFAHPLLELRDEKYLDKFFELLDYSFALLEEKKIKQEEKVYWEYINYIWRIVIGFVENLKKEGSFVPILALEAWLKKHSKGNNYNWLMARIKELKASYINYIRPFDKLTDGIEELNKINAPAAQIAYFLFKAQIVETKLRHLIEGINYFLELATKDFTIFRKATKKKEFKYYTLGQLKLELNKYQGQTLIKLDTSLSKFKEERNQFTHELFLQKKDIHILAEEASIHTKNAEESLKLIQEVWREILKIN